MSTNKTQNYQLHAWVPGDNFLLSEINANFAAIDGALMGKAEVIGGMYLGNDGVGANHVELGAKPRAVLVCPSGGFSGSGMLALAGVDNENCQLKIGEQGFYIQAGSSCNEKNRKYLFLALV